MLIKIISYYNSKFNYSNANLKQKEKMDKMRYIACAIGLDMLKEGVLANKDYILNYRFHFNYNNTDYFVIAELYQVKIILSYIGSDKWDYHLK